MKYFEYHIRDHFMKQWLEPKQERRKKFQITKGVITLHNSDKIASLFYRLSHLDSKINELLREGKIAIQCWGKKEDKHSKCNLRIRGKVFWLWHSFLCCVAATRHEVEMEKISREFFADATSYSLYKNSGMRLIKHKINL